MVKKIINGQQLKNEAEMVAKEQAKKQAEEAEKAGAAEMKVKWETELNDIEQKKREEEEARKAQEEAKRAEKADREAKKATEKAVRQRAKKQARLSRKAKKGPGLFDKRYVSLYIADASLKLLVTKGKYVTKWAEIPLETDLVSGGVITNPAAMADKIRELFISQGIKGNKVIAGFSGLHCLSRMLTLPILSRSLLDEAVKREAQRELPVPLENLYLAWQIVHVSKEELKVFLIAYTRNVVESLVETFNQANLKPYLMDLAPLAITRVVNKKTAVIADIRPSELDIVVMVEGIPRLIRSLPLPYGKSLKEELPIIKEELERTIKFYNSNDIEQSLGADLPVFVSGELVDEPALYQSLSDGLGYTVLSPLPPFHYPERISPTHYMVNIGLILKRLDIGRGAGLSRINLNALPDVYRRKRLSVARAVGIPALAMAIGGLVAMFMLAQNMGAYNNSLRNELEAANQLSNQRAAQQRTLNNAIAELEKRLTQSLQTHQTFNTAQNNLISQQKNLNTDLPLVTGSLMEGMTLTNIKHLGSSINLSGKAPGDVEVLTYARALAASARYSEVIVASMIQTGTDMDFSLILKLTDR